MTYCESQCSIEYKVRYKEMTALPNCVRCIDKSVDNTDPPCIYAFSPKPTGVLSTTDMTKLGYCGCVIAPDHTDRNRLANADRFKSCGYKPRC